jgi:polyisoprenyl-phosphate glycosyltransferase
MPDVSVVLPLYRTAAVFDELCERLEAVFLAERLSFELVCVDDACPADSGERLRRRADADPRVVPVFHESNQGQRKSTRRGLGLAQGMVVIVMDADLQDRPEDIPLLLAALGRGDVDAVFAGRRGSYQSESRMAASRLFKTILHWVAGVPADAGSFVALSRKMVDALLAVPAEEPYLLALVGATGLPVRSVPVQRSLRPVGQSAYSEWARLSFAWGSLSTAFRLRFRVKREWV